MGTSFLLNITGSCVLGSSSEYMIEGGSDIVNGCYERLPQTNKNDYHEDSKYPIYRKTSGQMYLMLENAPSAHWIFSNDLEGENVRLRKMVGNFDYKPDFGRGRWKDQVTSKYFNLVFKLTCENIPGENKRYRRIIPRFSVRPAPVLGRTLITTPTPYEKDSKALEKSGIQQENIIFIAAGSVSGFVILLTIFVVALIRRRKAQRQREFMENNPI